MKILAIDINNLTDARYFAAWNVDFIGLNINPGAEEYISPEYFHALQEWIEGPQYALQINEEMLPEKEGFIGLYQNEAIVILKQPAEGEDKEYTLLEMDLKQYISLDQLKLKIEQSNGHYGYLLNGHDLNFTEVLDQIHVDEAQWLSFLKEFPIFITLNFDAESIIKCLDAEIYGICLRGGEEEAVGVKSFDDLDVIFETIESYQNIES